MTESLMAVLTAQAAALPNRAAVMHRDRVLSFSKLRELAEEISNLLEEIPSGGLVHIQAEDSNWCTYSCAYFGVAAARRVPVVSRELPEHINAAGLSVRYTGFGYVFDVAVRRVDSYSGYFQPRSYPLDVVFTSGTTGVPTPYLFSHEHFLGGRRVVSPKYELRAMHAGIPFTTSTGAHGIALRHLLSGVCSICADKASTVDAFIEELERLDPFEMSITPFELKRLVSQGGIRVYPRLRTIRVYAGPLQDDLREAASRYFPNARFTSIYGLTEAGAASMLRRANGQQFAVSEGTEGRVWLREGSAWADVGQIGEILVKQQNGGLAPIPLFVDTKEYVPEGWVRTGDLGSIDERGDITLLGRAKDLVVIGSTRVSAGVLEERISKRHPHIGAVTAFNIHDTLAIAIEGESIPDAVAVEIIRSAGANRGFILLGSRAEETDLGKPRRAALASSAISVVTNDEPTHVIRDGHVHVTFYRSADLSR